MLSDIAVDDELTRHMIRRQFLRHNTLEGQTRPPSPGVGLGGDGASNAKPKQKLNRRDSIAPFPGLRAELQGLLSDNDEISGMASRLEALEDSTRRIEDMLGRLVEGFIGSEMGGRGVQSWTAGVSDDEGGPGVEEEP